MTKQEQNDQILHSAAVGDVATNWEYLRETIEVVLLNLAGCPDYRSRVLTERMSFHQMSRSIRNLLRHQFDDDFVAKNSEFAKLWARINYLRDERNRIVHAAWLESRGGTVAYVSAETSKMSAMEKSADAAEIRAIADQFAQAHEDLLNFVTNQCGFLPLPDKYELPRHENGHPLDRSR